MNDELTSVQRLNPYELDAANYPAPACYYAAGRVLRRIGWHRAHLVLASALGDRSAARQHGQRVWQMMGSLADLVAEFDSRNRSYLAEFILVLRSRIRRSVQDGDIQSEYQRISGDLADEGQGSIFRELVEQFAGRQVLSLHRRLSRTLSAANPKGRALLALGECLEHAICPSSFPLFHVHLEAKGRRKLNPGQISRSATESDIRTFVRKKLHRKTVLLLERTPGTPELKLGEGQTIAGGAEIESNGAVIGKPEECFWFPPVCGLRPHSDWLQRMQHRFKEAEIWQPEYINQWRDFKKKFADPDLTSAELLIVIGDIDGLILSQVALGRRTESQASPPSPNPVTDSEDATQVEPRVAGIAQTKGPDEDQGHFANKLKLNGNVVSRDLYEPVKLPAKILPYLVRVLITARDKGKTVDELGGLWPKKRPSEIAIRKQIQLLNSHLKRLQARCTRGAGVDPNAYVLVDLELLANPPLAID